MALSDEQRAMLRLLAQREQGYDDIAALMGLSVEEVRAKVADALSQIEAEGEPAPDVPSPESQVSEIDGLEDARPEAPKAAPSAPVLPKQPAAAPLPPAPPASKPAPPTPAAKPAAPASGATSGGGSSDGGRTVTIPSGGGLWPWIGGGVAIIVIVVLAILLIGGSGGDSSSSSTAATTTAEAAADTSEETQPEEAEEPSPETGEEESGAALKGVTQAILKPVGSGSGTGKAIFGRVKNKLALQVVASGLETTGKGDAYTIWLAQSEQKMLPLASSAVAAKDKGKIAAQYEVPTEVLSYLANGTFDQIFITHTDNAQLAASLKEATQKKEAPGYVGEPVLNGTVTGSIVGAALREEEAKEAEEKGE